MAICEKCGQPIPDFDEGEDREVTYKGRTYRLLWKGDTKYGERAHLQFTDRSKDFWVDADLVEEG